MSVGRQDRGGQGPAAGAVSQPSSPLNLARGGGGGGQVCTCTSACKTRSSVLLPLILRPSAPGERRAEAPVQSLRQRSWVPRNPDAGAALYLRTESGAKHVPGTQRSGSGLLISRCIRGGLLGPEPCAGLVSKIMRMLAHSLSMVSEGCVIPKRPGRSSEADTGEAGGSAG